MISIILVVVGVALVLWGADRLTDGATALAQRMNGGKNNCLELNLQICVAENLTTVENCCVLT